MAILKAKKKSNFVRFEKLKKKLTDVKPLNLDLDRDLLLRFKAKTSLNETSMTEVITYYIRQYVETK